MAEFIDPVSGLAIGDTTTLGKLLAEPVPPEAITMAVKPMILSASGWRKVFARSGNEEDASPELSAADALVAGLMAKSWVDFMAGRLGKPSSALTIALAMDSRPSGTLMADAMLRTMLAATCTVKFTFIASAPEAMAYARMEKGIDGFVYISASHNPVGHNGVKFGFNNGGVIGGEDARILIEKVRALFEDPEAQESCRLAMTRVAPDALLKVFQEVPVNKKKSLQQYDAFSRQVISDSDKPENQAAFTSFMKSSIQAAGIGIVAELNGSARCLTIDQEFFESLGAKVRVVNGRVRNIAHRIVPEGRSLDQCREELEKAWKADKGYSLGYVPDNDGDRGNIVWLDAKTGKAHIIEAQEVFALTVLAEVAHLVHTGKLSYGPDGKAREQVAIAVNDPTSMRIDEMARAFDVEVYRAEVGEANVVNLAVALRSAGKTVRILGEGSNGGNITHPAAVRDPLNTVVSILKLLTLKDKDGTKGLFHIWCDRAGLPYKDEFSLGDVLDSIPAWISTSAYEDRAITKIRTEDHARLKSNYETVFQKEWEARKSELQKNFGIVSWEEINYEGTKEIRGLGKQFRSGKERGGFKILFKDQAGNPLAYQWMRGSGTEPVFRVSADTKGKDPAFEAYLLDWHVAMIQRADLMD